MPWSGRFASPTVLVLCLWALAGRAGANPVPIEVKSTAGRVVPAAAVPVDVVSEDLRVSFVRHDEPPARQLTPEKSQYEAIVSVRYVLRADTPLQVPVLFPVVGETPAVEFRVNGRPVPIRMLSDIDILGAYEAAWRRVIDRVVASDRELRAWRNEVRSAVAAAAPASLYERDPYADSRLSGRTRRWWVARGAGDADELGRALSEYLLWYQPVGKASAGTSGVPAGAAQRAAESDRRSMLRTVRELAVALQPRVPDPAALWGDLPVWYPVHFAVGQLDLQRGTNDYEVTYRQFLGLTTRYYADPKLAPPSSVVPRFEYLLRTARFWRSFGTLRVEVALPEEARWAECSLPGADIALSGPRRHVRYAGEGVPAQNLCLLFAPCKTTPPMLGGRYATSLDQAPLMPLRARWDASVYARVWADAAPAVEGNTVAAACGEECILCDRATGRVRRRLKLDGEAGSLLLLRDRVLVGIDILLPSLHADSTIHMSGVACYDRASGRRLWQAAVPGKDLDDPHVTRLLRAGDTVVAWSPQTIFAVSLADGRVLWQAPFYCRAVALSPEAVAGQRDGLVYFAGRAEKGQIPEPGSVHAVQPRSGRWVWGERMPALPVGLLATADSVLVVYCGTDSGAKAGVIGLEPGYGSEQGRRPLDEDCSPSGICQMLVHGDHLLLATGSGLSAYQLGTQWRRLWCLSYTADTPVVVGHTLYVGTREGPAAVDLASGKEIWRSGDYTSGGPIAVDGRRLYTLQQQGGLLTAWQLPGKTEAPGAFRGRTMPEVGKPPDDLADVLLRSRPGAQLRP